MIQAADREYLRRHLVLDEGLRLGLYWDCCGRTLRALCTTGAAVHRGKLSIGIGRNIEANGITALEAYDLNDHDIDTAIGQVVSRFPWFHDLDTARQIVLVELMFNMGPKTLGGFTNTLAAFARHDFVAAVAGLKASKWFRQVQPSRSGRIIQMTATGELL